MVCGFFGGPFAALLLYALNVQRAQRWLADRVVLATSAAAALGASAAIAHAVQSAQISGPSSRVIWRVAGLGLAWWLVKRLRHAYVSRQLLGVTPASAWLAGLLAIAAGIALELLVRSVLRSGGAA
jgi:hypothetical protein